MSRSFYKDAVGAFVVSDLTRVETLDTVITWKEELDSKVQLTDGSKIPCFLLGNKVCIYLRKLELQVAFPIMNGFW